MELLDRPLLDRHLGVALSKRNGGLLSPQKWGEEEESWVTGEAVGEGFCLGVAELGQRIDDVVRWNAACIRNTLAVANEQDSNGLLHGSVGHLVLVVMAEGRG